MILQPCNVELTKIHYYDKSKRDRNLAISTISREVCENNFNRNLIIKKNVFGHRWVLKINEQSGDVKKKSKIKVVVYVLVFCSIVVAVCFGIFLSVDKNILGTSNRNIYLVSINNTSSSNDLGKNVYKTHEKQTKVTKPNNFSNKLPETSGGKKYPTNVFQQTFCAECNASQVCLKVVEVEQPRCVTRMRKNDPTGCGGLCPINTHFCQTLDYTQRVYQCSKLKNILACPAGAFNCGNRCISEAERCDGVVHCSNRSDEENCACNLTTHFQCGGATSCLDNSKRCDRKIDCWDKSDELDCPKVHDCNETQMPCDNGQCIWKNEFCDGKSDCADKTDEPDGCQI